MFFDQLNKICHVKGTSPSAAAVAIGMSKSAVTRWKNGQEPTLGDVIKLSEYLEVDVSELIDSKLLLNDKNNIEKAPTLTKKDERDIARDLEAIMNDMANGGTLMFDGQPMSEEAKESIFAAMKLGLEAAKIKNKERFTPKKYRK
ncbi:MAG: helix-turn-helix domain-containing protein [Eubacteriales bacterium]